MLYEIQEVFELRSIRFKDFCREVITKDLMDMHDRQHCKYFIAMFNEISKLLSIETFFILF